MHVHIYRVLIVLFCTDYAVWWCGVTAVCHLCPLVHSSVRVSVCRERGGREAEMAERQRWNERENERITRSVNGGLCLLATPGVV